MSAASNVARVASRPPVTVQPMVTHRSEVEKLRKLDKVVASFSRQRRAKGIAELRRDLSHAGDLEAAQTLLCSVMYNLGELARLNLEAGCSVET